MMDTGEIYKEAHVLRASFANLIPKLYIGSVVGHVRTMHSTGKTADAFGLCQNGLP